MIAEPDSGSKGSEPPEGMHLRPPEDTPKAVGEQADPGCDASATRRTSPPSAWVTGVDRIPQGDPSDSPEDTHPSALT